MAEESILNRETPKRTYFLLFLRISLAIFLTLSSAAILYTTDRNYRSAETLADQSLESIALALSSSAEDALRRGGSGTDLEIQGIFSDRVVAYALIAEEDGKILFHTNPRLVGSFLSEEERGPQWGSQKASGRRVVLGTGLPAFEFSYPLHRADGRTERLRLVLQTTSADRIVSDARRMWWVGTAVLALLWTVGILFERILTRSLRLRAELEEKKQLALIGQMTAVLAHEIRNALGSVKGYAQWVDEKLEPPDPKKAGLRAVLRGAERIESLVRELLLFSRDEAFHLERVNPIPLLNDAIQTTTSSWPGKVEMVKAPEVLVLADKEKLGRVFLNGVRNAIQAMGEKGTLRISARLNGRWVEVVMEDTGPGIPEAEIPRLFTPFHTTKTDGTGLGLAYSRKVVEGMGGRISLVSRERGKGAVLTVQLPS
jgi:two-component system, NtrC family, sensor histidine kinase HydH